MRIRFRLIDVWPPEFHRPPHSSNPFRAAYSDTLSLVERELDKLGAHGAVIQLALAESDIRLDGLPRAGARPAHTGVILAFDSKYGPLKYATDAFPDWQANLRAIALGLEALRKVDRYGITKRGEQYTGWKALPSGEDMDRATAREPIDHYGGMAAALKATHPDQGGSVEEFARVQAARRVLTA